MKKLFILCAIAVASFTACTFEGSITSDKTDSTATLTAPMDTTLSDSAIIAADTTVVAADTTK